MGSKKLQVWLPLLFSLVMVLGMVIGYQLKERTSGSGFLKNSKRNSIQEVMDLVRTKYVDSVKTDSLTELAIDELLSHLDPHSTYIPADELKMVNEDLMGSFQGIGIEFQLFEDTVNVINVMKDGPSEKAGLQVGDKFIKVNDSIQLTGKNINQDKIRKYLRGQGGSTVKIEFIRNGQTKSVTITRGTIPVSTIDAAYIIAPQTGFIRINKFGDNTYREFMTNLESLQKQGMQKLILDLRGNGGGLLEQATKIADEFLDGDKLIVYTKGANSEQHQYNAKKQRDGLFEKGKLILLVDETSASASEVLAGALQDWDRATIIGRRTFGKGLVQQQFKLSDNSAVRLTIARYYTPLGRNIQKPYTNKSKKEYQEELMERYHDGEMVKGDTSKPIGAAFKTASGRIVYGGGGITPDVFIAADTSKMQKEVAKLYYKYTLNNFIYNYYIQNLGIFKSIKSPTELVNQFQPSEKEWQSLQAFAKRDSIDLSGMPIKDKLSILQKMKSLMAKQLFRSQGYFEANNTNDAIVQKALALVAQ
jgi:carboxyl-terminal processing protease